MIRMGEYAFIYDFRGLHAQVVLNPGAADDVPQRLRDALVAAIAIGLIKIDR